MPSRDIKDCTPELQQRWPQLKAGFEAAFSGWRIFLTCTHRTPEEQLELFKRGRAWDSEAKCWLIVNDDQVITYKDGKTNASNHNYYPSKAFDVALQSSTKDIVWKTTIPQWQWVRDHAKDYGLVNGGNWKTLRDFPHMELV